MTEPPRYDRAYWEALWSRTVREHGDVIARRPPSAHVVGELAELPPGRALDAGCGHGAEALWLAANGWEVTALDFSPTVLDHARARAETLGPEIASRITWLQGDLTTWAPAVGRYDLVCCLYVHVPGDMGETVRRMASGVAAEGTLLLVGHQPIDPATGERTPAAGQNQVSVPDAVAALEAAEWKLVVAEDRRRAAAGSGVDAVVRAQRTAGR